MPQPPILLKKGLWYRCFPVNFVKFKRATASVFKKSFYFRNMKNILNLGCSSFKYEAYSDKLLYKKFVDSVFCFPKNDPKICTTNGSNLENYIP